MAAVASQRPPQREAREKVKQEKEGRHTSYRYAPSPLRQPLQGMSRRREGRHIDVRAQRKPIDKELSPSATTM